MNSNSAPANVGSNDGLGPLVDAEMAEYSSGAYADHGSARDQLQRFADAVRAAERKRWEPTLRSLLAAKWCTPEYEKACRDAAELLGPNP